MMKTRPTTTPTTAPWKQIQRDTAVEYTITHALSTSVISMGITTDHINTSRVMSLWAIFHPLGYPYDSSCSYYINTMNCFKYLSVMCWIYSFHHPYVVYSYYAQILASHMYNPPARHLPFNLGFWSEYHYEKKFTSATMALNSALTDKNEWCAYVETRNFC